MRFGLRILECRNYLFYESEHYMLLEHPHDNTPMNMWNYHAKSFNALTYCCEISPCSHSCVSCYCRGIHSGHFCFVCPLRFHLLTYWKRDTRVPSNSLVFMLSSPMPASAPVS